MWPTSSPISQFSGQGPSFAVVRARPKRHQPHMKKMSAAQRLRDCPGGLRCQTFLRLNVAQSDQARWAAKNMHKKKTWKKWRRLLQIASFCDIAKKTISTSNSAGKMQHLWFANFGAKQNKSNLLLHCLRWSWEEQLQAVYRFNLTKVLLCSNSQILKPPTPMKKLMQTDSVALFVGKTSSLWSENPHRLPFLGDSHVLPASIIFFQNFNIWTNMCAQTDSIDFTSRTTCLLSSLGLS